MTNYRKLELTTDEALMNAFDAEHDILPFRVTAQRIAGFYGHSRVSPIVDDIAHALEDAEKIGELRGLTIPNALQAVREYKRHNVSGSDAAEDDDL